MKSIFFLILSAISINYAYAQDPVPVNSKDVPISSMPNASSGGDNYNVDLYTGVVNIQVPIYNYTVDGLDLGVSLSYSGSGVKVDQTASNVGLGWGLNYGGYIERAQVNGVEDEVTTDNFSPYRKRTGYWVTDNEHWEYSGHDVDLGPDVFLAVFGGRTLKFAVSNGVVQTMPRSDIKLDITYDNVLSTWPLPQTIGYFTNNVIGFIITDEHNNVFEFELGDKQEKLLPIPYTAFQRWVLKKITTYSGQEINYEYTTSNVKYPQYKLETIAEIAVDNTVNPLPNNDWHPSAPAAIGIQKTFEYTGSVSTISKITYPNGVVVTFNRYPNTDRADIPSGDANTGCKDLIDYIHVESKYDNNVKNYLEYRFSYNYFNTPANNAPSPFNTNQVFYGTSYNRAYYYQILLNAGKTAQEANDILNLNLRLKLMDIMLASSNESMLYYTFSYNSDHELPSRLSPNKDWYGYYNGKSPVALTLGNTIYALGIPKHTVKAANGTPYEYGTDRTPDVNYLKTWVLNSVVNQNGGKMSLNYKSHSITTVTPISDVLGANSFDGLCIDNIVFKDGFNNDNDFTIYYDFTDGKQFFNGQYFWYPTLYRNQPTNIDIPQWPYDSYSNNTNAFPVSRDFQNHIINPMDYLRGSNHGYTDATVTKKGFANELISKSTYHFWNTDAVSRNSNTYNHFVPGQLKGAHLGLLLNKKEYGNSNTPLNECIYDYKYGNTAGGISGYSTFSYDFLGPDPNNPNTTTTLSFFATTAYSLFDMWDEIVDNVTIHNYTGNQTLSTVYEYDYNDTISYNSDDHLRGISWTDSKGQRFRKQFLWNYDYYLSTTEPAYLDSRLHFLLGEHLWKIDLSNPSNNRILSYALSRPTTVNNNILFLSHFTSTLSEPISEAQLTDDAAISQNASSSNFIKAEEVLSYDAKKNALEMRHNDVDDYSSTIWDTKINQKIADVENARYHDIAYTSFEGGATNYNPTWAAPDYNKGNWIFDPSHIECYVDANANPVTDKPITGSYFLNLPATQQLVSYQSLTANKTYSLSFWATSSSPTAFGFSGTNNNVACTHQQQAGVWHLYTAEIIGSGGQLHMTNNSGNSIKLDELRLHPPDAPMTTYTYQPLFGVSSVCDPRNGIVYYEYDKYGRPYTIRDINNKIISVTKHVVQGANN